MVVFTKDNKHIIKFIDVPNYKLEDNPKNESEAKFSQDSEKLAHTPILYEDAFKGLGTNIKKPMLQNIDTFISNAHKKNFQDKKNFFCYDRLTLLSALIKHDKEEFFLSKILKNDAALINDITCGTARNPFNNIFLEKKNVLKVFFIILRADIKIDFDNLLKLAEKDDVIDKISKNPDNPLVIFRTLKKAGIKMQNEYSDELLEINIKSFQRNILSIVTNFIDTKLKSDDKNMINICKKLINLLSTSEKIELKHDEIEILRKNKLGEELRNFAKSKDNDKIWELFGETDKNNPDKTLRGLIALIVKLPEIIIKHNKDSDLTNIDQSPKNN